MIAHLTHARTFALAAAVLSALLWLPGCGKETPSPTPPGQATPPAGAGRAPSPPAGMAPKTPASMPPKTPAATLLKTPATTQPAATTTQAAADDYPLTTCVVSGDALGTMGEPIKRVIAGREVRFCCEACIAEFEKDPAKYLAILNAAAEAKRAGSSGLDALTDPSK